MRYILLTGLLTFVYAALVVLAIQVLRFHAPVAVAAATLAAALLFNQPRRRLQRVLNRRYHRPA
jgi:predicted PurR-regulated permease PerM